MTCPRRRSENTFSSRLRRLRGSPPQRLRVGWDRKYGESSQTPQLLAQAGIRYVCDWANDEQHYAIKVPQGQLFALPLMLELDDLHALWNRRVTINRYREMLKEGFDTMYRDGERNGRVLVLNLHPWLIGQPFRIRHLEEALGYITRRQGVWAAAGQEIVDWYQHNLPVA